MPSGPAFERKPKDHDGPSFNWIEYFESDSIKDSVRELRQFFATGKNFNPGATAIFAVLNVEKTRAAVIDGTQGERHIEFIYDPVDTEKDKDPSHVVAPEIKLDDELVTDIIATTVIEVHPAKLKT